MDAPAPQPYRERRPPRAEIVNVTGLAYGIRAWDGADEPVPLLLLHGWMDIAASFQFVVDAMKTSRRILGVDWRGFGETLLPPGQPGVTTPRLLDFVADLDALVRHYAGADGRIDIAAHSMGANIALIYAGLRPARVRRLVSIEGLGGLNGTPATFTRAARAWLDTHANPPPLPTLATQAEAAARIRAKSPNLTPSRAAYLAPLWAAPAPGGVWRIRADPRHRVREPNRYPLAEILELLKNVAAPVLHIEGLGHAPAGRTDGRIPHALIRDRLAPIPGHRMETVAESGHSIHHEQPEELARLIEDFLS